MKGVLVILINLLLVLLVQPSYGAKVLLKEGDTKSWHYTSVDTGNITSPGWNDATNHFGSNDVKNGVWLVTDSVKLPNVTVNYHVDIKATLQNCPHPKTSCLLQVFYTPVRAEKLHIPDSVTDGDDWQIKAKNFLLKNFILIHNVTFNGSSKIETKSFNFSHNGSIATFGIRARGIHGVLYNMKLYYYYCEETLLRGVRLARTNAPPSGWKNVDAQCRRNAVPKYNQSIFEAQCSFNGTWSIGNDTECLCRSGYEISNRRNVGCERCPQGFFKSNKSNEKCISCPAGSTNDSANTLCSCQEGKYRMPDKPKVTNAPCYGFPSKVRNLKVKKVEEDTKSPTVILSWDPPLEDGGMPKSLRYDVNCVESCTDLRFEPKNANIEKTWVQISRLTPGKSYIFKVSAKNNISELFGNRSLEFENITYRHPQARADRMDEFLKTEYIIVAGISVFLAVFLIVALVRTLTKRRTRQKKKCMPHENGITLPDIGQKMYVDPQNYGDAETALKEFANEVDPNSVCLERLIGGGEFGDVYKGTITLEDRRVILVAAKTLKANASDKSCRDFFLEASAMGQFDDPNVIHLEGVVTKVAPKMILTEFMSNGSLDHFLKKTDGELTAIQLFSMARDVASGMKYLASINFVHRDLAARNILVSEDMACKVADFGLSRELETEDSSKGEYFTTGGKIPVRWTAQEAIKFRIFSTASDVWSYGILLWEIMSSAQRPYWDWDNFKVIERVDGGFRLPSPVNCPQVVHDLMLKCWDKDRKLRPRFEDILTTINKWIESPESLHQPKVRERSNQLPYAESSTSVKEWLDEIKMASYMPHFAAAGYEQMSDLAGLLDSDLKDLGISLVGHRNKMLRTIRSLPNTEA